MTAARVMAAVVLTAVLSSCASIPQWSDNPQDCTVDPVVDVVTAVKWSYQRKYICVNGPEVVKLPSYVELLNLPPADTKPVVAVYGFSDKTGQRKESPNIALFSTSVTQGGVELLIDALKTAGGGTWFRVVERQGLDHLVRERQIIRTARDEAAKKLNEETKGVGPLLFAGIIVEGGIVGYDSNVRTGGRGARYLGIGRTKQYREDVVTVSLRAVSVLTGEVLLNVQTTKTILSYGSSGDIFRFVEQGTSLVEYEDGVGNNESVTYAVRTAIEAAVLEMVYQGHDRGFWTISEGHRHPHNADGTQTKHNLKEEKEDE